MKNESLTLKELAEAYLDSCYDDCRGDSSVGIPPCPFCLFPDDSTEPVYCRLMKYLNELKEGEHEKD